MAEDPVLIDRSHAGIVVLTLNRPERRNALNATLLDALCAAIQAAGTDRTRRVLVLRGAGAAFCAGLDLQETLDETAAERNAHRVLRTLRTVARSRLISIACVQGAAMAGGAGLMAACDFAVAADDAKFGLPEVRRGLVAAIVMCFLMRNVAGRHVRSLVLQGNAIDAREAAAIGLINRAVPPARLVDEAMGLAGEILKGAPQAIERTKTLLDQLSPWDLSRDLDTALSHHMDAKGSLEAREGLRAFLEKRAPMWQTFLEEQR